MPKRVRRFSQGSPIVSSYIRDIVSKDIHYKDGDEHKLPYLKRLSHYSLVVPIDGSVMINQNLENDPFLTDRRVKTALEESKLINWCPGIKRFIPLSVTNDGNTLCHSTSVALWGIHDRELTLRRLISSALRSDEQEFKNRWLPVWKRTHGDNCQDAETEWHIQLEIANETNRSARQKCPIYDPLEDLHIFVLANVIRRPIIVFADRPVRSTNEESELTPGLATIYLPLLWPSTECVKSPIVLGYCDNYFAPLVTLESNFKETSDDFCPEVVPINRENSTPIEVRYLTDSEQKYCDQLLREYLNLVEIEARKSISCTMVLLAAKMTPQPLDETQNLLRQFLAARSRDLAEHQPLPKDAAPAKVAKRSSRFRCGTKECSEYITNESMFPFCMKCYKERNNPPTAKRKNTTGNLELTIQSIDVECTMPGCPYYASVNCFPFCQRCHQLRSEAKTKGEKIPTTLTEIPLSLEDCWKKLSMGVIDEEFLTGFASQKDSHNEEILEKLKSLEVKDELVYCTSQKVQQSQIKDELDFNYKTNQTTEHTTQRRSSITSARSAFQKEHPNKEIDPTPADTKSEWKRRVSWVNEPCGNSGCSYFASIRTYPFCNQCASNVAEPKSQHSTPIKRKVSGCARTLPTLVQED